MLAFAGTGWTLGCSDGRRWHHRRSSITAYLKQQYSYAKAEALLAEKWPGKYNGVGHDVARASLRQGRRGPLFQRCGSIAGKWGSALFQSIYEPSPGLWPSTMLMPEWCFLLMFVGFLTALGGIMDAAAVAGHTAGC
jgi:hypothetical protein